MTINSNEGGAAPVPANTDPEFVLILTELRREVDRLKARVAEMERGAA